MPCRRRCLFLSYSWAADAAGRDTCLRVNDLAAALRACGWGVWVDVQQHMHGPLESCLHKGLCTSDAVLLCLTESYCRKLDAALHSPALVADNCMRELNAATALRKPALPVVLDPCLLAPTAWGTALTMRAGAHLYADATSDPPSARAVHRVLCGLFGGGPLVGAVLQRGRRRPRSRVRV